MRCVAVRSGRLLSDWCLCRVFQCGPGGCLWELSLQLAIIMVGKQALLTIWENILP